MGESHWSLQQCHPTAKHTFSKQNIWNICCVDAAEFVWKARGRWKTSCQSGPLGCRHVLGWCCDWENKSSDQSECVEHGACQDGRDTKEEDGIRWVSWSVTLRILQLLSASQSYELEWNKWKQIRLQEKKRKAEKNRPKRRETTNCDEKNRIPAAVEIDVLQPKRSVMGEKFGLTLVKLM